MKKILYIISLGLAFLYSCGSKQIDKSQFSGTYALTDLHNPMYESDYAARKKMIDTTTKLDIGRMSFWQTDNLDSVKKLELKMLEDERNMMLSTFKKMGMVVINDSIFVRTSPDMTDTCIYQFFQDDKIVYRSNGFSNGRMDTMLIDKLNASEIILKEKFLNTHITTTYTKK